MSFVVVSRAPLAKDRGVQEADGLDASSGCRRSATDFNYDYQVSFTPDETQSERCSTTTRRRSRSATDREGVSVFYKDDAGAVFHTYSCYARGIDMLNGAYNFLDLVPKGRDEDVLAFSQASGYGHHDRYEG